MTEQSQITYPPGIDSVKVGSLKVLGDAPDEPRDHYDGTALKVVTAMCTAIAMAGVILVAVGTLWPH